MITISFHFLSIVIGFFIGFIVVSVVTLSILYDERWSGGFGEGFKAGKKYQEELEKPKDGEA